MKIIFCDNHLLVVSKPAGISTQPHVPGEINLLDQAKRWLKKEYQKSGNVFLEPIHRLDKPVSGLVLFARTSKALSRLQEMMRQRQIEKTYFAWVEGVLDSGTLEHYLFHDDHRARVVEPSHPQAKLARLHYVKIDQRADRSLVEIQLETGRYHQIRAQFAAIGHPVLGDQKYGSTTSWKKEEIALHHGRMKLSHPVTKSALCFEIKLG
jgi:23S rRNA pseudouridine1911/1915/1917 synthase